MASFVNKDSYTPSLFSIDPFYFFFCLIAVGSLRFPHVLPPVPGIPCCDFSLRRLLSGVLFAMRIPVSWWHVPLRTKSGLAYCLLWKQITQVPGFLSWKQPTVQVALRALSVSPCGALGVGGRGIRMALMPSAVPWIVKSFPCDPGLCCVPLASTKQWQANLLTSRCSKVRSQRLGTVLTNTSRSVLSGGTGSRHPCSLPHLRGRVPFSSHYEWR